MIFFVDDTIEEAVNINWVHQKSLLQIQRLVGTRHREGGNKKLVRNAPLSP